MERNFDLSIYQMPEGIRARSQYPRRGKQSISNDRSIEKTVVQLMSIIPQSVAVSLSLHIPNCDITANERRQDGYIRGLKTTLQSLCDICEMWEHKYTIYDAWLCPVSGLSSIDHYVKDLEFKLTGIVKTLLLVCQHCSYFVDPLLE